MQVLITGISHSSNQARDDTSTRVEMVETIGDSSKMEPIIISTSHLKALVAIGNTEVDIRLRKDKGTFDRSI